MGGVDFNPNAGSENYKKSSTSGDTVNINNQGIIQTRSFYEGPTQDTVQISGSEKKEKDGWVARTIKNIIGGLVNRASGESQINFVKESNQRDDGSYVLSEPFKAATPEEADAAANTAGKVQQGRIQKLTGNLFMTYEAEPIGNGQYVMVAKDPM